MRRSSPHPRGPRAVALAALALAAGACGEARELAGAAPVADAEAPRVAPQDRPGARARRWRASEPLIQLAFESQLAVDATPRSQGRLEDASIQVPARGLGLGRRLPDLAFTDLQGAATTAEEVADGGVLVLLVRDTGCPVSRRYGPALARLEERFADEPVRFLYLYRGEHETADAVREDMRKYGCRGRAVLDGEERFGPALGIRTTTEAFVFDARLTLAYRGAVDDRIGRGVTRDEARHEYVADAVDALLAGDRPRVEATTAPGCLLSFERAAPALEGVTWHREVSRIVQRNCAPCHREGGAAPFPLARREDLAGRKRMIAFVVEERVMPPWFVTGEGGPWRNDASLEPEDAAALLAWIEADCPEGDPDEAPLVRTWPAPGEWTIGEPDEIIQIPEPILVPAEGRLEYQRVLMPPTKEGRWIKRIEVQPTAPEVVHHVTAFYQDARGSERAFEIYVPGKPPTDFPLGQALYLPKGVRIEFSIHYTPIGVPVEDQTRIGVVWAEEPPEYEVIRLAASEREFEIPPGDPAYPVTTEVQVDKPILLRSLTPHMHLRGKAFRVEVDLPDAGTRTLLDLPEWDFDWQLEYELAEPLAIPAGSVLRFVGTFDNSAGNPSNPDPTVPVRYGRWSDTEMMLCGMELLLK